MRAYYHAGCLDGVFASLQSPIQDSREWNHKNPPPAAELEEMKGRIVHFYDVCPEPEVLIALAAIADKILIIDHHTKAVAAAPRLPNIEIVYSPDVSACILAHSYFKNGPAPKLLLHISNEDTFKKIEDSELVALYLRVYFPVTRAALRDLIDISDQGVDDLLEKARYLDAELKRKAVFISRKSANLNLPSYNLSFVITDFKDYETNYITKQVLKDSGSDFVVLYNPQSLGQDKVMCLKIRGDNPQVLDANNIIAAVRSAHPERKVSGGGHPGAAVLRIALNPGEREPTILADIMTFFTPV